MTNDNNNTPPVPNAGSNQPPAPYGQNPQAPQYGAPQYGAPQAQQGQYGAPQGQYGGAPAKWNVLSIITLVSSILGFSIISIVLGIISLNQIKKTGEQGKVLAIVGIVIGALATIGYIIFAIIFISVLSDPTLYETY